MEPSPFSVQVQFVDDHLSLVHIPLGLYPFFVQPILQLLFHDVPPIEGCTTNNPNVATPEHPGFLSISITPVECSVICSRALINRYFATLLESYLGFVPAGESRVQVSREDYIVMQVDGQGLDAGRRVLELTGPLSLAGVSIFFISTYFSDYILFPRHCKRQVVQALQSRVFVFETSRDTFNNNTRTQYQPPPSSLSSPHPSPSGTPPPTSLSELQNRTFACLRRHNVRPHVDRTLQIVQCAAHYRQPTEATSFAILRPSLVAALLLDRPRFLSLTVTATDPSASILLEKRLLPRFSVDMQPDLFPTDLGRHGDSLLLGSKDDTLIPIILDLRDLPLDATGIVCGVAGRMSAAGRLRDRSRDEDKHETSTNNLNQSLEILFEAEAESSKVSRPYPHNLPPATDTDSHAIEMSFLSTARAGTVIVREEELCRAMASLEAENHHQDFSEVLPT
ncbi:hypothetical protein VTO42DRAFT_2244 [Malbranchea cinnamomea]